MNRGTLFAHECAHAILPFTHQVSIATACVTHLMTYDSTYFLPHSFCVLATQTGMSGLVLCSGFAGQSQCVPRLCSFLEVLE